MKHILAAVALCAVLFPASANAAESISGGKSPVPLSADPEAAPEAKLLNQKIWTSQFTQGMRNHPDAFRDNAFRRYYGARGTVDQGVASINDTVIRYGKNIPGVGSGYALLEEFAKDSRQWLGGLEERKSIAAGIINYCRDCMDRFASDTFDLLVKQKRGQTLTSDEKVLFDSLNEQIGKGIFKNIDASWKELAAKANPNDLILWQGESLQVLFGDLSRMDRTQYRLLIKDSQRFRSFVGARIGSLEKTVEHGFAEMRSRFSEMARQNQAAAAREKAIAKLQGNVQDLQAGAGLAVSLLNVAGRGADAQRLSTVSTAALSAYEMILRRAIDPTQVSQVAVTATSLNAIVVVASIMQDQNKKSETQYVLEALAGISEQIGRLSADVGYIRQQVQGVSIEIEDLRRRNDAQYGALYDKVKALQTELADDRLTRWMTERSKVSSEIEKIGVECKAVVYQADGVDFDKADPALQKRFRSHCLSPLLVVLTVDVASAGIVGPSKLPISGDGALQLFQLALQGQVSPELWYPTLGDALLLSRNPLPTPEATANSAAEAPPLVPGSSGAVLAKPMDLELWRGAMNAYAYAILSWPTYIPSESRPEDKIILELESKAVALAEQIERWLNQRLSTDRFNAAVESYRESALAVFRALNVASASFIDVKKRTAWCSEQSMAALAKNVGPDEAQWLLFACEQHGNGGIHLTEQRDDVIVTKRWTADSPVFPVALLLFRDEFQAGAKRLNNNVSTQKLAVSDGRKFSRDEFSLIAGLRTIDSAVLVLQRLTPDAPDVRRPAGVKFVKPKTPSSDENWDCLEQAVRTVPVGDIEGATRICTRQARQGCVEVKDSSILGSFSYKLCDGPIDFQDARYKWLRGSKNFKDGWTQLIADESIARNRKASRASFILRRHGVSQEVMSKQEVGANLSLRIKGIDMQGLPSLEGVVRKSSNVDAFKFQVEEEFEVSQAANALNAISGRLDLLQDELVKHLKSEDSSASLRPVYDQLNRSYANLMLHTYLYLQMDVSDTPALKKFLRLPISGYEIAESIAAGKLPSVLGQRLLLSDDSWFKGFPSLEAFEFASDRMSSRDCAPDGRDLNLLHPPRRGYELNLRANADARSDLTEDMYCKMWAEQVTKLTAELPEIHPLFGGRTFAFNRGSLFLNDGLDAWARVSNERAMRKLLKAAR